MCTPVRVEYDFSARRGKLVVAANQCCDMAGCIDVFSSIDPDATVIDVYSGGTLDVRYMKGDDKKWKAFCRPTDVEGGRRSDHP